jgi:asparagine synthetase B (glutamine-hydrolysing)
VHNGEIINIRKKLKSYNNNSDTEILFYFIQNQVEPIVREILSKAFLLFSEDNNINNFEALTDKLEKDIINSFI